MELQDDLGGAVDPGRCVGSFTDFYVSRVGTTDYRNLFDGLLKCRFVLCVSGRKGKERKEEGRVMSYRACTR